jgi:hypothetical protein
MPYSALWSLAGMSARKKERYGVLGMGRTAIGLGGLAVGCCNLSLSDSCSTLLSLTLIASQVYVFSPPCGSNNFAVLLTVY